MNKTLKDISWLVTEEEYRRDHALSYSTLARYEREGFNNLGNLFTKVESPSLTLGSIVDTLITGTDEEFNERFMVAELNNELSDTVATIVKKLFSVYSNKYNSLTAISEDEIISVIEDIQWNNHWLPRTRVKKIKEDGAGYYGLLYLANGRTIISTYIYNDALKMVDALRTSPATKFYFEPNNMFDNRIQRFYQLKFKATFDDVDYRCMADLIVVLNDKKLIIPVDLKTSSSKEWDFAHSFDKWCYMIQGKLYANIIRDNISKDDYFKDYTIAPYKFIVVNRYSLTPLVWDFEDTFTTGDLIYGKNSQYKARDPFVIGKELQHYLKDSPKVPDGIFLDKPNSLRQWLNKL